jgi:hypothetical protein
MRVDVDNRQRAAADVLHDFGDGYPGCIGNLHRVGVGMGTQIILDNAIIVHVIAVACPAEFFSMWNRTAASIANLGHETVSPPSGQSSSIPISVTDTPCPYLPNILPIFGKKRNLFRQKDTDFASFIS